MKIDLHTHTWYSPDGVSPPEKIIRTVQKKREKGLLDGIAVTDHNMIRAWKHFKNVDFPVVFGEEVKAMEEGRVKGDILGLFLTEEIKSRDAVTVVDEIHAQGGIAVIPHPFDKYRNGLGCPENIKKTIDGMEVFNSRMRAPSGNGKALAFAKKNHIAMTGGSDAHIRWEIGNAFTEAKSNNLEEFRKALEKRETRAVGRLSVEWILVPITKFSKWGVIGRAL